MKSSNVWVGAYRCRLCGDWITYINTLQLSDIAFVSTPLNYFRQHQDNVRTRAVKDGTGTREVMRVQRTLLDRYGRRNLVRDDDKIMPQYVSNMVSVSRMPPHNKVPPAVAWNSWRGLPAFIP